MSPKEYWEVSNTFNEKLDLTMDVTYPLIITEKHF